MWYRPKSCILLVSLLGAFISEARADIGWQPERTWVFAVGILSWKHPDVYDSFPDAIPNRADRRLVDALKAAGVPADHVVFLVDERATLAAIRRAYLSHLDRMRRGDLLIFYFAGHGARDRTTRATYFANYDADADLASHWPVREVFDTLETRGHAARAILMADCCHSGALYDEARQRTADLCCACLTSASSHNSSTGNWTFTEAVLKGFQGNPLVDADADGEVALREVADYAEQSMAFLEHQKSMFATTDDFDPGLAVADTRGTPAAGLGRRVEVEWNGTWYPAEVVGIRGGSSLVHYADYDASWDEWVGPERIRDPQVRKLPRGCRVKVLWPEDRAWYRGTVLASRFGMHRIHYDGYSHEWDDWVASDAIKEVDE
ncbi:MAG: Tudor-knot domain-containing protein [Planctomycetaceae bacterium]